MRISDASHHLKKTSLWDSDNQAEAGAELLTPDILSKATATIRASLGVNAPQNVWVAFGQYLQKYLLQQNGVSITNFGTFGFDHNDEPIFVQDPVFLHMTRLCLASRKHGKPVQPLLVESEAIPDIDFNSLATEFLQNCSKDLVKSVISSVLAWVVSWAKDGQQMRLSFLPIGEWICDGDSVDFRFMESFRKEAALKKVQERELQESDVLATKNTNGNNEFDEFDDREAPGDSASIGGGCSVSISDGKKSNFKTGTRQIRSDSSFTTAKEDATRNSSLVEHSRYHLRAPTFSSIAKQMPPLRQRYNRTDEDAQQSTSKAKSSVSVRNKQSNSSLSTMNPAQRLTRDSITSIKSSRPGSASSSRGSKSTQRSKTALHPTAQQSGIINRLRARIMNRRDPSFQGLNTLAAVFKTLKTNVISLTQLSLSLRKLGVKISAAELKEISAAFALEKSNFIDTSQLLDALRGEPLSGSRLDLVTKAFHLMDPTDTGEVNIDEMIKHYDVGFLPQVRDGRVSRLKALAAFLQEWAAIDSANTNTITFESFSEYYHNVSACIDNDADFARLMQQAWKLYENLQNDENQPPLGQNSADFSLSTTDNKSVASAKPSSLSFHIENPPYTHESSSGVSSVPSEEFCPHEAWMYLRMLLLSPKQGHGGVASWPTLESMCRRLSANRVLSDGHETMNVKAFASSLMLLDKRLTHEGAYDLAQFVAAHCAESRSESDTIELVAVHHMLTNMQNDRPVANPSIDYNYIEFYASRAIERIRARVAGRRSGANEAEKPFSVDLNALEKWLQASSSNGDSLLLKYELRGGLMKVGIDISYQDLDYIFAYFDVNRQGFINCEAFLDVLRNPSKALPKLETRQEKTEVNPVQKTVNVYEDLQQKVGLYLPVSPKAVANQRKQVVSRELPPNFRRRNLIHRTIWDQTMRPGASEAMGSHTRSLDILEIERRRRYRASQLIQTAFRGYRARQIVAQLRRNAAAKNYRFATFTKEQERLLAKKKKANRPALPNTYGF